MRARLALLLATVLASPASAAPQILAACGPSQESSFYFEGGAVGPGQGGWRPDGVTDGRLLLTVEGDKLDLLFAGREGALRSHVAEGSSVRILDVEEAAGSFSVLAENRAAKSVEHFLFRLNPQGIGTVAWGTFRVGGLFSKSSLYTAPCGPRYR